MGVAIESRARARVCLWSGLTASRPSLVRSSVSTPYQQHFVVPASLSGLRICTTSPPDIQQPPSYTCTLSLLLTNGARSGFRPVLPLLKRISVTTGRSRLPDFTPSIQICFLFCKWIREKNDMSIQVLLWDHDWGPSEVRGAASRAQMGLYQGNNPVASGTQWAFSTEVLCAEGRKLQVKGRCRTPSICVQTGAFPSVRR